MRILKNPDGRVLVAADLNNSLCRVRIEFGDSIVVRKYDWEDLETDQICGKWCKCLPDLPSPARRT
jgi:hypothetical protein